VGTAVSALESLINSILSDDPNVTVLVGGLIPTPNLAVPRQPSSARPTRSLGPRLASATTGSIGPPSAEALGGEPTLYTTGPPEEDLC
jgi:hypothetical protein